MQPSQPAHEAGYCCYGRLNGWTAAMLAWAVVWLDLVVQMSDEAETSYVIQNEYENST